MVNPAIGMIETRGLTALVMATDAMLKASAVEFMGWRKVGSGLCSAYVKGDVAAVRTSLDAGIAIAREVGQIVNTQVLSRPHDEIQGMVPKR
ncbi:MAG: BMC domain-containing protein [Acidobacteriota bacterium]|nr:BMC domain-containing protein [Acidobacteriota bacterium]